MDTCSLAYSARVTPNPAREKIHIKGATGGACVIMPTGYVSLLGFKHPQSMNRCFARALAQAGLRAGDVLLRPTITNATFKLSQPLDGPIDLQQVVDRLPNANYDRLNFPGVIIKSNDGSTCTLFENGQLVVTGVKSKTEGHRVLQRVVDSIYN